MNKKEKQLREILEKLKSLSNPKAIEGMTRFGITPKRTFGVSIPNLRKIAREIGKDHACSTTLGIKYSRNSNTCQYD
jgi:3-methyladenine DNA glycosylase AlkD